VKDVKVTLKVLNIVSLLLLWTLQEWYKLLPCYSYR